MTDYLDDTHYNNIQETINIVAYAIHCWSCVPCLVSNAKSDDVNYDHVTDDNRLMAAFLVGALGLTKDDNDS